VNLIHDVNVTHVTLCNLSERQIYACSVRVVTHRCQGLIHVFAAENCVLVTQSCLSAREQLGSHWTDFHEI
jgi:hypothetical protein